MKIDEIFTFNINKIIDKSQIRKECLKTWERLNCKITILDDKYLKKYLNNKFIKYFYDRKSIPYCTDLLRLLYCSDKKNILYLDSDCIIDEDKLKEIENDFNDKNIVSSRNNGEFFYKKNINSLFIDKFIEFYNKSNIFYNKNYLSNYDVLNIFLKENKFDKDELKIIGYNKYTTHLSLTYLYYSVKAQNNNLFIIKDFNEYKKIKFLNKKNIKTLVCMSKNIYKVNVLEIYDKKVTTSNVYDCLKVFFIDNKKIIDCIEKEFNFNEIFISTI